MKIATFFSKNTVGLILVGGYFFIILIFVVMLPFSMGWSFIPLANITEPLGQNWVSFTEPWRTNIFQSLESQTGSFAMLIWMISGALLNSAVLFLFGYLGTMILDRLAQGRGKSSGE